MCVYNKAEIESLSLPSTSSISRPPHASPIFWFQINSQLQNQLLFPNCPLKQENTEQKMKYSESNLSYKDGTYSSPRGREHLRNSK